MAKNANVSDGTLPIRIGKKKTIVERTTPRVIKRPKVIGNIKEINGIRVSKYLKLLGTLRNLKLIGSSRYLKRLW